MSCLDSADKSFNINRKAGKEALTKAKEITSDKRDSETKSVINAQFDNNNKITDLWWSYLEKIEVLLESNSGLIKKNDFAIIKEFLDSYTARKFFGKIDQSCESLYLWAELSPLNKNFIETVEKFKKHILKEEKEPV